MSKNKLTQKKYFIGLTLIFLTFCSGLVQAQSISNRNLRFRAGGYVDLTPSYVYYADNFYKPTARNIGVKLKNIGSVATYGIISFEVKGLPVNLQLMEVSLLPAGATTITIDGTTIPIDNANWNLQIVAPSSGSGNAKIVATSILPMFIAAQQEVIIGFNVATHPNNFGDNVSLQTQILGTSGGDINANNNWVAKELVFSY